MKIKRFIYCLPEEEFLKFVYDNSVSVEVVKRKEGVIYFAVYKKIDNLKPVKVEEISDDWKNWKENFKPIEIEDFIILPPWRKPVFIKPGLAFGTGLHPTTQLCIKALKKYLRSGMSVLDVGTGSGILAVVSKLLGASYVLGIDISDDAVRECKENAEINGLEIECLKAKPKDISKSFDLVVANLEIQIFEKVLRDILPKFNELGIFSGLYREEDLENFKSMVKNYKILEVFEKENWFAIVLKKA